MKEISTRLTIFMQVFYLWTLMVFYLSTFVNYLLGIVIRTFPDNMIPPIRGYPVNVVKAVDESGNEITNKLNLFMKYAINITSGEDSIFDLDMFYEYIGSSIIWIMYIMEYDDIPVYKDLADVCNSGNPQDISVFMQNNANRFVSEILIDNIKKKIYRIEKNNICIEQDILFGEVEF